jgi:hypothetical protein
MRAGSGLLWRLYSMLLKLYPPAFRVAFEGEMRHVFRQAIADAGRRGRRHLAWRAWKEYVDCVRCAAVEQWLVIRAQLIKIADTQHRQAGLPGPVAHSWRSRMWSGFSSPPFEKPKDTLWAVAPLFLFGLGISLYALVGAGPLDSTPLWRTVLSLTLGLLPALLIGAMTISALIRRIPDQYWVWVGAGYLGFVLFVEVVSEERAEVGKSLLSPTADLGIAVALLILGAALMIIAALRGWRQAGLLGIGLSGMLGLSLFVSATAAPFYRYDLALIAAPAGAIFSALAFAYLRSQTAAGRAAALVGTLAMNILCLGLANPAWADWTSAQGQPGVDLPLLIISAVLLLISPLLRLIKSPLERALGRR